MACTPAASNTSFWHERLLAQGRSEVLSYLAVISLYFDLAEIFFSARDRVHNAQLQYAQLVYEVVMLLPCLILQTGPMRL